MVDMAKSFTITRQSVKNKTLKEEFDYFQKRLLKEKIKEYKLNRGLKTTTRERVDNLLNFNKKYLIKPLKLKENKKSWVFCRNHERIIKIPKNPGESL